VRISLTATLLATVLAGLATGAPPKETIYIHAEKSRCKFHYDEKLETRALSALQLELTSNGARYYDASRPIITICHNKATLMFSGINDVKGRELLDPSHIYIDVDICSHHILAVDRDDGMTVTNDPPCA
jgi:hypothetical protein